MLVAMILSSVTPMQLRVQPYHLTVRGVSSDYSDVSFSKKGLAGRRAGVTCVLSLGVSDCPVFFFLFWNIMRFSFVFLFSSILSRGCDKAQVVLSTQEAKINKNIR